MSDLSRVEQLLRNALGEDIYEVTPQSRVETLLVELNELIEGIGGSVSPEDIATAVSAYLDEHLTNPTNPPIDTSLTIAGAAADAKKTGDKIGTVMSGFNDIKSEVYETRVIEKDAPNLFEDVDNTELHLGISNSGLDSNTDAYGFYVDVSEYQGSEIVMFRTNRGYRLRGVFTTEIPRDGVSYIGDIMREGSYGLSGGASTRAVVPNGAQYLYVIYYVLSKDTISRENLLAGFYIGKASNVELKSQVLTELHLGFTNGTFSQADAASGFYVDVGSYIGRGIQLKRSVVGNRFRLAFANEEPNVGVAYEGYTSTNYDNADHVTPFVPDGAKYLYILFYNSEVDSISKSQLYDSISISPNIPGKVVEEEAYDSKIARLFEEKVDVNQGAENSGKVLRIGGDGMIVPSNDNHTVVDDTLTVKGAAADSYTVGSELYTEAGLNLYDDQVPCNLGIGSSRFEANADAVGFYVPVDPAISKTVTIQRNLIGKRFRAVACTDVPNVGVTYDGGKILYQDASNRIVYDRLEDTDSFIYIMFQNASIDTYTREQLLAGMTIYYGTEYQHKASKIDELNSPKAICFENAKITDTGSIEYSPKYVLSSPIKVRGRFGVSCPSTYRMTVSNYDTEGRFLCNVEAQNITTHFYNYGTIRICICAEDQSDITPETVDFSQIKIPANEYSAYEYTKHKTRVIDAENAQIDDVYRYIDEAVDAHPLFAKKTLLCVESSGLPIYYYTIGNGAKKILLISGQHGDGNSGDPRDSVITTAKIVHDIIDGNFENGSFLRELHDDYTILVIPIFNVYGFNYNNRRDANNVDTNRDWVNETTPQVLSAKALISDFDPFMILDIHCNGTTPTANADVEIQFGIGSDHNVAFRDAISPFFASYYNMAVAYRNPNAVDTLDYYVNETLGKLGGLLELRWWLKNKNTLHDYQAESGNYALVVNTIKYCAAINDGTQFAFEHTPNQNQY